MKRLSRRIGTMGITAIAVITIGALGAWAASAIISDPVSVTVSTSAELGLDGDGESVDAGTAYDIVVRIPFLGDIPASYDKSQIFLCVTSDTPAILPGYGGVNLGEIPSNGTYTKSVNTIDFVVEDTEVELVAHIYGTAYDGRTSCPSHPST